jgi:hypothetical protein
VLEVRVATLEAKLERSRQRRSAVIEHYEQLLDERGGSTSHPVFSWTRP